MGMWLQNKFLEAKSKDIGKLTNAAKLSSTEGSWLQQQGGYEACLVPIPFPAPSLSTQRCDKHHLLGSFCFSIMVKEAESRSSYLKFIHTSGWWYIHRALAGHNQERPWVWFLVSLEKKITLLWLLDHILKKPFSNILEKKKKTTVTCDHVII